MGLLRKIVGTLRTWTEREDGAPQIPPVPGRPGTRSEPGPNPEAGLAQIINQGRDGMG